MNKSCSLPKADRIIVSKAVIISRTQIVMIQSYVVHSRDEQRNGLSPWNVIFSWRRSSFLNMMSFGRSGKCTCSRTRVVLNENLRIEFPVLKKRLKYILVILDILTDNSVTVEHRVLEADIDFSKKIYKDDKGDEEKMHKSISGLKSGHHFSNKMSFLLIA